MKKHLLSIALISSVIATAQMEEDSVSIGAGYTDKVFYSFENGEVGSLDNTLWDFAFQTTLRGSGIRINGTREVVLKSYLNGDTADWNNIDTVGYSTWFELNNADTTWSDGAFNQMPNSDFDLGWGEYSMITHAVTGDSLFLYEDENNHIRKVWIQSLANGIYSFKLADLDGSNELVKTLNKTDYNSNFVYLDIDNDVIIDDEPASDEWDIVFNKYKTELYPGTMYGVTGVQLNDGVFAQKVTGDIVDNLVHNDESFTHHIKSIGYDWKSINYQTYQWSIEDSTAYFVKAANEDIYKLVFSGFGGSSDGKFYFGTERLSLASAEDINVEVNTSLYPNPAMEVVTMNLNTREAGQALINIYDFTGRVVMQSVQILNLGSNEIYINIEKLPAGQYIVQSQVNDRVTSEKLSVL